MSFQHPFAMVVSGPSGSGKTEWTRTLLLSNLVRQPPERIIWCFGQWQHLYDELQRKIPWIEFVHGIPDYLNNPEYINASKRNLIVFDDLMKPNATRELPIFLLKAAITETYPSSISPRMYFLKEKLAGTSL
jgi:hypothetical protein